VRDQVVIRSKKGNILYEGEAFKTIISGYGVEYYDGEPGKEVAAYRGEFCEGKRHGEGESYHEDGTLKHKGPYREGLPYGEGISYHENGQIHFKGFFEDWMISRGSEYYKNGKLRFEGFYNSGQRHYYGPRYFVQGRLYRENGTLWFEGSFKISRIGSKYCPVISGERSFRNGFEYNEQGEQICTYLKGKPIEEEDVQSI
jgi:antitoxin component YwqK of YwqJK toxin-antitoxin module